MKTTRFLFIQVILLLSLYTVADAGTFSIPMQFGTPVIDPFTVEEPLQIPGTSDTLRLENWPAMPSRLIAQELPFGTRIESVSVRTGSTEIIPLDAPLPFTSGLRRVSGGDPIRYAPFDFSRPYPADAVT